MPKIERQAVKLTKRVGELQDGSPALMAELTGEFIKATDLNSRAKIRARMKAVLDFISVNTSYPDIDDKPQAQNQIGFGIGGGIPPYNEPGRNPGYDAQLPGQALEVYPIAGAENTL